MFKKSRDRVSSEFSLNIYGDDYLSLRFVGLQILGMENASNASKHHLSSRAPFKYVSRPNSAAGSQDLVARLNQGCSQTISYLSLAKLLQRRVVRLH